MTTGRAEAGVVDRAPRTPVEALRLARRLLAPDGAWLPKRTVGAVDGFGKPCSPRSDEACRRGLIAALIRGGGSNEIRIPAVDLLCRAVGVRRELWVWEEAEGRTQAEVLAALDAAIALAGGEVSP